MAAPVKTCICGACAKARVTIQQVFSVLDIYGWLLDSYIVDFFQEQLWEKLPNSWRLILREVSPREFGEWLSSDILWRVWPLSLLALRQVTRNLQLDRDHRNRENTLRCGRAKDVEYNLDNFVSESKDKVSRDLHDDALKKRNNLFLKHVKIKKRHEIQEIARICANCARESDAKCIVDVGAGMGHLARSLAFKYDLCVTCIEQNAALSQQAKKWDQELLVSITKHLPDLLVKLPQHVSVKLESTDFEQAETVESIQRMFAENFHLNKTRTEFGIVGLHPCGDLAATLLRLYTYRREARFICIVGCCYMKLTLEDTTDVTSGYPLSKYLSSFVNHKLSYAALEVACHSIESYCDKLKAGNYDDLIVHAYRAALETILIRRSRQLRHTQVRNVKVVKPTTFQQYCAAATADLELHLRPDDSDFQNLQVKRFLDQWRQIVIFGALRTMLAPLVETAVLLDRFLFLSENNLPPILKPIFDARLSPRNFLLFSIKKSEQLFS
ncbi:PREDICTED: protein RRNAD1-like isoform X2 [Dinoponera quadriceps]|uniref:Protein RRNAD1-like isoform X2 n=1 Tax=Dinoponera quadriceps TaxID=609295 RepID=A0A6P3YHN4_DINQU|nr:PREDICTED: protein RRNAD1-like isoform X2 [Dinoponera quadriceps]